MCRNKDVVALKGRLVWNGVWTSNKAALVYLVLFQPKWWERGSSRDAARHQDDRSHRSKGSVGGREDEREGGRADDEEQGAAALPKTMSHVYPTWKQGEEGEQKMCYERNLGIYSVQCLLWKSRSYRKRRARKMRYETQGRQENYCRISNSSNLDPVFVIHPAYWHL